VDGLEETGAVRHRLVTDPCYDPRETQLLPRDSPRKFASEAAARRLPGRPSSLFELLVLHGLKQVSRRCASRWLGSTEFRTRGKPMSEPDDLREFEQAAAMADRLAELDREHAANVAELARRLQA
jgi:hypothetical protein